MVTPLLSSCWQDPQDEEEERLIDWSLYVSLPSSKIKELPDATPFRWPLDRVFDKGESLSHYIKEEWVTVKVLLKVD